MMKIVRQTMVHNFITRVFLEIYNLSKGIKRAKALRKADLTKHQHRGIETTQNQPTYPRIRYVDLTKGRHRGIETTQN